MTVTIPQPAIPRYGIGERVLYVDRHGRAQAGAVLRVEAKWGGYRRNGLPSITYTVDHPSYLNGRTYVGDTDIQGSAEAPQ